MTVKKLGKSSSWGVERLHPCTKTEITHKKLFGSDYMFISRNDWCIWFDLVLVIYTSKHHLLGVKKGDKKGIT